MIITDKIFLGITKVYAFRTENIPIFITKISPKFDIRYLDN